MVDLPEVFCPNCRTNLRTGYTPPDNSGLVRGRIILGLLLVVLLIIAAMVYSSLNKDEVYQVQPTDSQTAPTSGGTDLDEAAETGQALAEANARVGAAPTDASPIINMTKDVVGQAQENRREAFLNNGE
jgi:hypothetical protein